MLAIVLFQFLMEFIRALLIEGLSARVRKQAAKARRNRRIRFYLRLRTGSPGRPVVRILSTEDRKKVQ